MPGPVVQARMYLATSELDRLNGLQILDNFINHEDSIFTLKPILIAIQIWRGYTLTGNARVCPPFLPMRIL
jgi:hypothetical protein